MKREIAENFLDKLTQNEKEMWLRLLKHNFIETSQVLKEIENYIFEFGYSELEEIRRGLTSRLTPQKILMYAKPDFTYSQMSEIRLGFDFGLSLNEVEMYANPKFTHAQMREIRFGFEQGLNINEIKEYAKPDYDYLGMKKIRLKKQIDSINKKRKQKEKTVSELLLEKLLTT